MQLFSSVVLFCCFVMVFYHFIVLFRFGANACAVINEILLCSSVVVLLRGSVMLFRPVISAFFLFGASGKVGNQNRE